MIFFGRWIIRLYENFRSFSNRHSATRTVDMAMKVIRESRRRRSIHEAIDCPRFPLDFTINPIRTSPPTTHSVSEIWSRADASEEYCRRRAALKIGIGSGELFPASVSLYRDPRMPNGFSISVPIPVSSGGKASTFFTEGRSWPIFSRSIILASHYREQRYPRRGNRQHIRHP